MGSKNARCGASCRKDASALQKNPRRGPHVPKIGRIRRDVRPRKLVLIVMAAQSPLDFFRMRMRSVDRRAMLRPLTTSEMGETAIRVVQRAGTGLMGAALAPAATIYAVVVFFFAFAAPSMFNRAPSTVDPLGQAGEMLAAYAVFLLVGLPLVAVSLASLTGLATAYAAAFVLGEEVTHAQIRAQVETQKAVIASAVGRTLWACVGLLVVALLLVAVSAGLSVAFRSNIWVDTFNVLVVVALLTAFLLTLPLGATRYGLAPAAAFIEGKEGKASLKRSAELLQARDHVPGGGFTILWAMIAYAFVGLLLWGGFNTLFGLIDPSTIVSRWLPVSAWTQVVIQAVRGIPFFLAIYLMLPVWAAHMTLLYFDRRVRTEALDIYVLTEDLSHANRRKA